MRTTIINQIEAALKNRETFFLREQDIQLYLANYFLQSGLFNQVFIEYHIPGKFLPQYLWTDSNNIYIDIVLENKHKYYPIEIKFKTVKQRTPYTIFGEETELLLGQHGATNIGCYDFWKDIKRIEFFEESFKNCERGIVLFITNDDTYRNTPKNHEVGYAPFSIHEGKIVKAKTKLNWAKPLNISEGRPGFSLNYDYMTTWKQLKYDTRHWYLIA